MDSMREIHAKLWMADEGLLSLCSRWLLPDAVQNRRSQRNEDVIYAGGNRGFAGNAAKSDQAYGHYVLSHALAFGTIENELCGRIEFHDEVLHSFYPVVDAFSRRVLPHRIQLNPMLPLNALSAIRQRCQSAMDLSSLS